eukprot:6633516-Pyramimonas_sp.AAC.1
MPLGIVSGWAGGVTGKSRVCTEPDGGVGQSPVPSAAGPAWPSKFARAPSMCRHCWGRRGTS